MHEQLTKYLDDPVVGPLISQHEQSTQKLNFLKQGLRSQANIENIIFESEQQVELRKQIRALVEIENQKISQRRWDITRTILIALLILVGIANLLF